jgi:hypothetical protein
MYFALHAFLQDVCKAFSRTAGQSRVSGIINEIGFQGKYM